MPSFRPSLLLLLPLAAPFCASADGGQACSNEKLFGDERRFECRVEVDPGTPPPRFVALFSGGHDDTRASVKAQVAGADAACGPGSKPELEGEDGNVQLHCRLPVAGLPAGPHVFTFQLRWHHAEYEGYRLER